MILYDRRLRVPSYVKELQHRSSKFTDDNNNTSDKSTTENYERKAASSFGPPHQNEFFNINKKREILEHQSSRRRRFEKENSTRDIAQGSSISPRSAAIPNYEPSKFSHRLCCRHVMDDFNVAPNYALRMERLRKETARTGLCEHNSEFFENHEDFSLFEADAAGTPVSSSRPVSARSYRLPTTSQRHHQNNTNDSQHHNDFSQEFNEALFRAGEKQTPAEREESINLREIQRRRRQQQFVIVPKTRPQSAGILSSTKQKETPKTDYQQKDLSSLLFDDNYHSSSRRPFSATAASSSVSKLSKLYLVAAKSLEQQKIDAELDELEFQEHEKERKRQESLIASRKEELTLSKHLGFSSELSTLEKSAAERNYSLTVQTHHASGGDSQQKKPLRFGGRSQKPTTIDRHGKPVSRSNSPSRSASPVASSSSRPTSAPAFFLTSSSLTKNHHHQPHQTLPDLNDANLIFEDDDDDDEDDMNDLIEQKLLSCMESKKMQLRPSSSNDRRMHTEQHERTITPVFKMENDNSMFRSYIRTQQQQQQRPLSGRQQQQQSTTATTFVPRPPSAASNKASSLSNTRKNMWLPDGALSNTMIKKSKYNPSTATTNPAGARTVSVSPRATTPRNNSNNNKSNNTKTRVRSQQRLEQTLQDVLSTPRGKNKNAVYDPLNSARRANSDRTNDVGMLVGQKVQVATTASKKQK